MNKEDLIRNLEHLNRPDLLINNPRSHQKTKEAFEKALETVRMKEELMKEEEEPPPTFTELLFQNSCIFQLFFATPHYDSEGNLSYPFGKTMITRHSFEDWPHLWRVYWVSVFPEKGMIALKDPEHGWLMNKQRAVKLAQKWLQ